MKTLCAKWNSEKQQLYDIREIEQVLAGNGVPYKSWSSRNGVGYYEYIPVKLAGGERLDDVTYTFEDNVITQHGTIIDAATVIEENEQAILDAQNNQALADVRAHGEALGELARALGAFGEAIQPGMVYGEIAGAMEAVIGEAATFEEYKVLDSAKDVARDRYQRVLQPAGVVRMRLWRAVAKLQELSQ